MKDKKGAASFRAFAIGEFALVFLGILKHPIKHHTKC